MNQALLDKIHSEQFRKNSVAFGVGDTVKVHTKVVEGDKERIQVFSGVVIGKRGRGLNETFTVRRISYGEGVERIFPLHSPRVDKITVERHGAVRRAKLTYLRHRLGKGATLVKEKTTKVSTTAAKPKAAAVQAKGDDLTEIEGVGPKIATALNEAGIHTFVEVAGTSVERLKEILATGGEHLKQWDPATWPEQAALAAKGDWDAFKKLKEELKGGRRV